MGSGVSAYNSIDDALADGKTQEEIDSYLNTLIDAVVKVREEDEDTGDVFVALAPFDISNRGRTMPMIYYYDNTLNPKLLISSLQKTLAKYPVYCGRYDEKKVNITLNNRGVPFMCSNAKGSIHEAIMHLLPSIGNSTDLI